jgi:hypothetical protein
VHLAITAGQLEAQLKVGLDQQRQVADQHQPPSEALPKYPMGLSVKRLKTFRKDVNS